MNPQSPGSEYYDLDVDGIIERTSYFRDHPSQMTKLSLPKMVTTITSRVYCRMVDNGMDCYGSRHCFDSVNGEHYEFDALFLLSDWVGPVLIWLGDETELPLPGYLKQRWKLQP
jgi:hypothetical protein